jgi:hypothetical protein
MRALISDKNVARLEDVTGTKITKNCDKAITKVLDELEDKTKPDKACWVEPEQEEPKKEDADAEA